MVGQAYDCLANPLGAVRSTFEKAVLDSDSAILAGKDWGVTDLFRNFLNDDLSQVPILDAVTVECLQPNTLVRFRGMIQDMMGNEFYVGAHKDGETWTTNKFTDVSQIHVGSSFNTRIWERRLLYCVPVPGKNSWTESSYKYGTNPCINFTSPDREKRQREDCAGCGGRDMQAADHDFPGSAPAKKMRGSSCFSPQLSVSQESSIGGSCAGLSLVSDYDRETFPCLVKIYDSPESDLKLNDVFEFVGVLTFDPELAVDKDGHSDMLLNGFDEDALVHLPPSKVPRLHCIVHRKLAANDFLSSSLTLELNSSLVKGIREALLGHLTSILGNDGLAANFMLLHLLSRVHTRVGSVAVGKLSLNLTCFTKESMSNFSSRIKLAVKNLVPFTSCIPLTIDYLNGASLAPTKDYQTNRLVSGVLQLPEGSHLTIDETQLQTGTLNSTGIENARLLKNLLEFQKVDYDFKYYKMEMAADAQVLILSEGKSNILPADVVLPFHPSLVGPSEFIDMEALKVWRWYLATLRSLQHSIDSEMQKVVEDDLVAAKQADRSLGTQEFSRWLTMGRLISMSFGETCLSLEHWQMVKELERLRVERYQSSAQAI